MSRQGPLLKRTCKGGDVGQASSRQSRKTDGEWRPALRKKSSSSRAEEEEEQMLFIPAGLSHIVTSSVSAVRYRRTAPERLSHKL